MRVKRATVNPDLTVELLDVEFRGEAAPWDPSEVAHHAVLARNETLKALLDFVRMQSVKV